MAKIEWVILIIALIFILYRLPLTGKHPDEMIAKAKELDAISRDKVELAKNIYDFINQSYSSPIRQYIREPFKVFVKDIPTIWAAKGQYMASNVQNEMAKEMLLLTGKFKEEDMRVSQGFCEISPHNVLFIKIDGREVAIDTWFADNGGRFNCYTSAPCGPEQITCLLP